LRSKPQDLQCPGRSSRPRLRSRARFRTETPGHWQQPSFVLTTSRRRWPARLAAAAARGRTTSRERSKCEPMSCSASRA
jgi:hypothetical protein